MAGAHLERARSSATRRAERIAAGLGRIVQAADRMQSQLDELVEASRAGTGVAPEPRLEPVDLGALLVEIAATYQASEREVRLDVGEAHVTGLWDRVRLGRVLDNLLSNAVKYSPPGSPVDVRLSVAALPDPIRAKRTDDRQMDQPQARWAVLTVSDRGIGIPEAEQPRVFEPFFRAANVTDCVPGTGGGLAATRQIVEALGGAITLRSSAGEGTTFTVHPPLGETG